MAEKPTATITPTTGAVSDDVKTGEDSLSGATPDAPDAPASTPALDALNAALLALADELHAASADVVTVYDQQIAAFSALPAELQNAVTARAIADATASRDAARLTVQLETATAMRARYAAAFDALARFGRPVATTPDKPAGRTRAATNGPTIKTKDGVAYTFDSLPVDGYRPTGARACASCQKLVETAGEHAPGNFRQNTTRLIATLNDDEMPAHAPCFDAIRDAEYIAYGMCDPARIVTVRQYRRA